MHNKTPLFFPSTPQSRESHEKSSVSTVQDSPSPSPFNYIPKPSETKTLPYNVQISSHNTHKIPVSSFNEWKPHHNGQEDQSYLIRVEPRVETNDSSNQLESALFQVTPQQVRSMLQKDETDQSLAMSYLLGLSIQIYSRGKDFNQNVFNDQLCYFTETRSITTALSPGVHIRHLHAISLIPSNSVILSYLLQYLKDLSDILTNCNLNLGEAIQILSTVCNFFEKYPGMSRESNAELLQVVGYFWNSTLCNFSLIEIIAQSEFNSNGEHNTFVLQKFNEIARRVYDFNAYIKLEKNQLVNLVSTICSIVMKFSLSEITANSETVKDFFSLSMKILEDVGGTEDGYRQFILNLKGDESNEYLMILKPFALAALEQCPDLFLKEGTHHLKNYLTFTSKNYSGRYMLGIRALMINPNLDQITMALIHETLVELQNKELKEIFQEFKKQGTIQMLERLVDRSESDRTEMEQTLSSIKSIYDQYIL